MIRIGDPAREMERAFLDAPGGFAWWYADLITPEGDGLVLIWAFGLPFLPGYAAAARRGEPQAPVMRPSVNLVVYERGRPTFYLLQEHDGEPYEGKPGVPDPGGKPVVEGEIRIGRSRFRSWTEGGRRRMEARLDCAVPGSTERLTGSVRIDGIARRVDALTTAPDTPHLWTPLTGPASGDATLDFGGRPLARLRGRAYHDRNGGRVPLHALGIGHWVWGRFPLPERERIVYLLWPERAGDAPHLLALEIDDTGTTHAVTGLSVQRNGRRKGFGGIPWADHLHLSRDGEPWAEIRHLRVVDDGPFYLRFQSEITTESGERALGWSELCNPARVDRALHRPLVRMRVHHAERRNSVWLPLFSGPRQGRPHRWLRGLLTSGAP